MSRPVCHGQHHGAKPLGMLSCLITCPNRSSVTLHSSSSGITSFPSSPSASSHIFRREQSIFCSFPHFLNSHIHWCPSILLIYAALAFLLTSLLSFAGVSSSHLLMSSSTTDSSSFLSMSGPSDHCWGNLRMFGQCLSLTRILMYSPLLPLCSYQAAAER